MAETIAAFTARFAGLSLADHAVRPLYPAPVVVGSSPVVLTPATTPAPIDLYASTAVTSTAIGAVSERWEYSTNGGTTYTPVATTEAWWVGGAYAGGYLTGSFTIASDASSTTILLRCRWTNAAGSTASLPYTVNLN